MARRNKGGEPFSSDIFLLPIVSKTKDTKYSKLTNKLYNTSHDSVFILTEVFFKKTDSILFDNYLN